MMRRQIGTASADVVPNWHHIGRSRHSDAFLVGRSWALIDNLRHHFKEGRDLFVVSIEPFTYSGFELGHNPRDASMRRRYPTQANECPNDFHAHCSCAIGL